MEMMTIKHELINIEKDVFQISEKIRFIGIMDNSGGILSSSIRDDKKLIEREEMMFEIDLHIISNIQAVFDEQLGKVNSMRIFREKVLQGVFYVNNKTVFISCEPNITLEEFLKIEDYMNSIKD